MRVKILMIIAILLNSNFVSAQSSCPPNIDFEQGNTGHWLFYTGTCCPINTPTLAPSAITNRHTLMSGTANDPYGNFPVVAPGGGSYSLRLGNNSTGAQAERARYYVRVPTGVNNYSLIYRYAVVFQNPNHNAADQPRFEVRAYDSATGANLSCAQFSYVSSSSLPGFTLSSVGSQVYYKSWSTASIDLTGQGGKTIAVDFASGDCDLGGHFGYGYIDLNCSLFQIVSVNCNGAPATTLTAPPGFQTYQWYNSNYSPVGSGQTVIIATPATTSQYHVVLTPYSGYGCPDTLTTTVSVSSLNVNATNDTFVCSGNSIQLTAGASGTATAFNYAWTPSSGLSCTNCANPVANPSTNTTYKVTVTDNNGCIRTDSVKLTVGPFASATSQNVSCFNGNNGSATIFTTQGKTPYSYTWNSTPVQTTPVASNLPAGTYNGIVTDANGCKDTVTVSVTQPTALQAAINFTNVSCNGGNNGSATVTATGGTAPYTYSWNTFPLQTTATIVNLSAGIYIATVTDSKGCMAFDTVTITPPPALQTFISTSSNVSCNGGNNGSATATVSGGTAPYSYSWNTLPVQTAPTANNLSAGTYTVTITDAQGCISTDTIIISQPQILAASISTTPVNCFGNNTGSATVLATGGTTPYAYWWNTTPVQTTAIASNLPAGSYSVTVTDAAGCLLHANAIVTQPPQLSATISNATPVSCNAGSNGTATVIASGGTTPYTYSWNTAPLQTTSAASGLTAGIYTATITDSNGCTDTAMVTITQPPVLTANMVINAVTCFGGNNGSATVTVAGGMPPYTYSWNTVPQQTSATAINLPAGNYTTTVTDNNGCVVNAGASVNQPAPLIAIITAQTDITCFGMNNGTAIAAAAGGTPPYFYSWNTTPVQNTSNAANLSPGTFTVIVTDNNGCSANTNVTISGVTPLVTTINNVTNLRCFGGNDGSASVDVQGGKPPYIFLWNTTPPQTSATAGNLHFGVYIVSVTDSNGCIKQDTVQITQPADIVLNTTAHATCAGYADGMAYAVVSGGVIPYSFLWSNNQTTDTIKNLTAGNYTVTVTDNHNCTMSANATVDNHPKPVVNAGDDKRLCAGSSMQLTATGADNYRWYPATGLSCSNCSNPVVTAANIAYTVVGTNEVNCSDTDQITITLVERAAVSVGEKTEVCEGEEVILSASGGITYSWSPENSLSNSHSAHPVARPTETTKYTVVITENECYKDTLSQEVIVHPLPTINLGPDIVGNAGSEIELKAQTTNASHIAWTPATNLSCADCFTPTVRLQENITYVATVINNLGCKASDDISIKVGCENVLFMPNTFTPNGDGNNDVLFPSGRGIAIVKKFMIYNRWGQKIFEATNILPNDARYGWDGTSSGERLPPDVFVYLIEAVCTTGEPVVLKGDVSMLR